MSQSTASPHRQHCANQVARLAGLRYFNKAPVVLNELIGALAASTKTDHHASAVIAAVLESMAECPTPAELRRIAVELLPIYSVDSQAAKDCENCGGTGWSLSFAEYIPIRRGVECVYVRERGESEREFAKRMRHQEREIMPDGRQMAEQYSPCACPVGRARIKREEV